MIKTVLILTLPRSGSSLLAGLLHRLGIYMGSDEDLAIGKHLNAYGCYEDQQFLSLGQNILLESHLLLELPNRLDIDEQRVKRVVEKYKDRYQNAIKRAQKPIWGFKEANLIYYVRYIEDWFTNIHFIYLKRNPEEITESFHNIFKKNNWLPELHAKFPLFTWKNRISVVLRFILLFIFKGKRYYNNEFFTEVMKNGQKRIEEYLQTKKFLQINLQDLINNPKHTIEKIIQFLGISLTEEEKNYALEFMHPELLNTR